MELSHLLEGTEIKSIIGETRKEIEGIAYHSLHVKKGFLFAAIRGIEVDGHRFIGDAIERGAEVVLLEEEREYPGRTTVVVPNSRRALAKISAQFYGNPSSQVKLAGITGTNGKTTTAFLLESILREAGHSVGVLGTINYRYGQRTFPAPNTTPESLDLQRILREMVDSGVTHAIMEVSSHGLDLDRVHGSQFDVAVFTNVTSDHLDYHKTLEHYWASKKKLFSELLRTCPKPRRVAVTNGDDPRGDEIVQGVGLPVLRYGLGSSCEVTAHQVISTLNGLLFQVKTPGGAFPVRSRLVGQFNLYNILAAVAAGLAMQIPLEMIKAGVERLEAVPGRFERVPNQRGIHVIVDYAHTHDALERVLTGLRGVLKASAEQGGKLITVFGCGGDRDRTKRPPMAQVAGRLSDLCILTSDNPRTEDPLAILAEAEVGFKTLALEEWPPGEPGPWRSKKGYMKVPDRREAIRLALRLARPSDTVLIAGKGHEDYQIIGKTKFPFDDRVEARNALEER